MIKVGIGQTIREKADIKRVIEYAKYGIGAQISFFQPDMWHKSFVQVVEAFIKEDLLHYLYAIHLPTRTPDLIEQDSQFKYVIAADLVNLPDDILLVVHPNYKIKDALVTMVYELGIRQTICVENFQARKKKELQTALDINEYCIELDNRVAMCLDTSHSEEYWFEYPVMNYLLRRTKIIHLSNRKGRAQHMPFNIDGGDLKLVAFVNDLIPRYNWNGVIILEYMFEYCDKLWKNAEYVMRLLKEKGNA